MFERAYQQISSLFPRGFVNHVDKLMSQGGFEEVQPRLFIGFSVFFSACIAVIAFFFTPFLTDNPIFHYAAAPAAFALTLSLLYMYLLSTADTRARRIEEVLPDMLQIISANMRAGMTMENAIWSAARPEFGPLRDEIKRVSADTFGGTPIQDTLLEMTTRVRSIILERAVRLIVEGIKLGGEMSQLLEEVAEDIKSNYQLQNQIATSTLMYVIFIVFASALAAPLLFAVSVFYSEMNEQILAKQTESGGNGMDMESMAMQSGMGGLPGMGSGTAKSSISSQDFWWFAIAALTVTNFLGALILSTVRNGHAFRGLRYAPLMALGAIAVFVLANAAIRTAFGSMLF
ncbi:MAG: type II secretion system F family protein [Candidatus Micrarchaeia archaeon]